MIAYLFPGQGSHSIGMGLLAHERSPAARDVFSQANEILGFDMTELCFSGPKEELTDTSNQQPALFVVSLATLAAMREAGGYPSPNFMAGHSLGELSALVAANAIMFEDGLRLVRQRGQLMKAAGDQFPGGMAAILALSVEQVSQACEQAAEETGSVVQLANDNCPGQIVISGDKSAVGRAGEILQEMGARKVVPLPITIAAHSPLMAGASEGFMAALSEINISQPSVPIIGNTTATPLSTVDEIKAELKAQLTGAVRWTESMQFLDAQGVSEIYEVGSGDVLQALMKRINRKTARKQFA
ncbi:MAG: ACP S-malonyltransferase [Chloroflexota bacterium]